MARWPWELFATQAMTITPIGNDKAAPCHVRAGSSQTQNASNAYRTAMTLLLQGHVYAVELKQGIWDFAVEIRSLNEAGLTNNDLRRLLIKGFVRKAQEITFPGEDGRKFRRTGNLVLMKRTCFVLTEVGVVFARQLTEPEYEETGEKELEARSGGTVAYEPAVPRWDGQRHELRVRNSLIKRYKVPSPNQEAILMAFEEEGWPARIDDPISPHPEQCPKRRLLDTIKNLNRNHKNRLIRFHGDGTGEGVLWEWLAQDDTVD